MMKRRNVVKGKYLVDLSRDGKDTVVELSETAPSPWRPVDNSEADEPNDKSLDAELRRQADERAFGNEAEGVSDDAMFEVFEQARKGELAVSPGWADRPDPSDELTDDEMWNALPESFRGRGGAS
jgi:hypothetical protein